MVKPVEDEILDIIVRGLDSNIELPPDTKDLEVVINEIQ